MTYAKEITRNIYMISIPQVYDHPNTAHYLIVGDKIALIEAAFVSSLPYLERALLEVGVRPEDIDYVIATHFHIDHTGAIGALLMKAPKAKVVINYRNYKVLSDPARHVRGTQLGFGYAAYKLFGTPLKTIGGRVDVTEMKAIVPVPLDRIMAVTGDTEIDLGRNMVLKLIYTPGHEIDHTAIYESRTKTLFPSEAVSVYNSDELRAYLPPASGGPYDVPSAKESILKLKRLSVDRILLPHFGEVSDVRPQEFLDKSLYYLDYWYAAIDIMLKNNYGYYRILDYMVRKLLEMAGYRSLEQLHEYFRKFWFAYLPRLTLMGYIGYMLGFPPPTYKPFDEALNDAKRDLAR